MDQTSQILNLLHRSIKTPATEIVQKISTATNTEKDKVTAVIREFSAQVKSDVKIVESVAKEQNLNSEHVLQRVPPKPPAVIKLKKNITKTILQIQSRPV